MLVRCWPGLHELMKIFKNTNETSLPESFRNDVQKIMRLSNRKGVDEESKLMKIMNRLQLDDHILWTPSDQSYAYILLKKFLNGIKKMPTEEFEEEYITRRNHFQSIAEKHKSEQDDDDDDNEDDNGDDDCTNPLNDEDTNKCVVLDEKKAQTNIRISAHQIEE
eukprot:TRINITY_DN2779_c0_g1_i1.p2 TRINITY_DN2779_c0_g1~~TRINITY_DN2779_c0_g1_i1.p2  ORF type:complete len:164 (-),score=34.21 TRINITY_DN2779_c0_g1_i1:33-524(-)